MSTVHIDDYDIKLGAFIIQTNKLISFFLRKPNKTQCNFTIKYKKLLSIVEHLKQFRGILFGYEMNTFPD